MFLSFPSFLPKINLKKVQSSKNVELGLNEQFLLVDSEMSQLRSCGWAGKSRRLAYCGEGRKTCREESQRPDALENQRESLSWFPKSLQLLVRALGKACSLWVPEKPTYAPENVPFLLKLAPG